MKTLLSFFILISVLNAGDLDRISTQERIYTQGLNISALNSIGFSNMFFSSAIDYSSSNPAALNSIDKISVGINSNYSSKTNVEIISGSDFELKSHVFPASASVLIPLSDYKIAFSYYKKYYYNLSYNLPLTSIEQPDGTGEFLELTKEQKINSLSGAIATGLTGILNSNDRLSLGFQIDLDMYSSLEKTARAKATLEENDINWKLGANYSLNDNFQFGLLYETGLDVTIVYKVSGLQTAVDTNSMNITPTIKTRVQFPDKMAFGAQIIVNQDLSLASTLSYIYWESVSKSFKNHLDISFSAIYSLFDFTDISLGFYQTDRRYNRNEVSSFVPQTDDLANFICAGVKFKINDLTAQLVVLDSHLSSGKSREQTIVNLGLGYSFH